jgi:hypothetical protein
MNSDPPARHPQAGGLSCAAPPHRARAQPLDLGFVGPVARTPNVAVSEFDAAITIVIAVEMLVR